MTVVQTSEQARWTGATVLVERLHVDLCRCMSATCR